MEEKYCRFEWPLESLPDSITISESYDHFEQVETKLLSFMPPIPTDNKFCGEVVRLRHRGGQILHVGISPIGFMLEIINPSYGRFGRQMLYSLREFDENFDLGFNDPAFTDYPNTVLHDQGYALKIVKQWLDTGSLPVFLVPDRQLGPGWSS